MNGTERPSAPASAAWTPPPGVPGPLNPSTGHTGPRMGGVLAPVEPAQGVEEIEHLDFEPGCGVPRNDGLEVCGQAPVTHALVGAWCACLRLLLCDECTPLARRYLARQSWVFCLCGSGTPSADLTVVPL